MYSFKIFLVEILLLEDIQNLVFILGRNFLTLFKIGTGIQYIAATVVPIVAGGIIFVLFIAIIPFERCLHGKKSKYFLTNMYRMRGSLPLTFILFVIKPIILSCIQAFHPTYSIGSDIVLVALVDGYL